MGLGFKGLRVSGLLVGILNALDQPKSRSSILSSTIWVW